MKEFALSKLKKIKTKTSKLIFMKNILSIIALTIIVLTSNQVGAQTIGTFKPSMQKETFNAGKLVQIDINFFCEKGLRFYGKGLLDQYVVINGGKIFANPCCDRPVTIVVDSNDGQVATYYMKPGAEPIVLASTDKKARISVSF